MKRPCEGSTCCYGLRLEFPAAAGFALFGLNAQSTPRPEFEVASVKPVAPSDTALRVSMISEHGRINYTNVTVRGLVREGVWTGDLSALDEGIPAHYQWSRYNIIASVE